MTTRAKSVLVTGGLGYIGQHLVRRLSAGGWRVYALGRRRRPTLLAPETHTFLERDVSGIGDLDLRVDAVVHLAAGNGSAESVQADYDVTVTGTRRLVQWCAARGVEQFLFFSTAQVYGRLEGKGFDERTVPQPVNDYGLTHYFAEQIVEMVARTGKLRGIVLRPSIVYGDMAPSMERWNLTPGCFVRAAVERGEIVLNSNGNQFRNYVPLQYVGESVVRLLETTATDAYEVYNVAGPETTTVRQLAQLVSAVTSRKLGRAIPVRWDESDPTPGLPFTIHNVRLEQRIGVRPEPRLEQEIDAMVSSFTEVKATSAR